MFFICENMLRNEPALEKKVGIISRGRMFFSSSSFVPSVYGTENRWPAHDQR